MRLLLKVHLFYYSYVLKRDTDDTKYQFSNRKGEAIVGRKGIRDRLQRNYSSLPGRVSNCHRKVARSGHKHMS